MVTGGKIWYVTCILHFIWILLRNLTFTLPTFKKIAVIPPYVSVCLLTVNSEISQWVILMPYPKMPTREHREVGGAMCAGAHLQNQQWGGREQGEDSKAMLDRRGRACLCKQKQASKMQERCIPLPIGTFFGVIYFALIICSSYQNLFRTNYGSK